jgi:hypothetical protein
MKNKRKNPKTWHKVHPKSLANLKPFKKGEPSGNPKGRPKGSTVAACLLRKLDDKVSGLFDRNAVAKGLVRLSTRVLATPVADALAEMILKEALKGNLPWLELVLERTEGAVPTTATVNVTGNVGTLSPIQAAEAIEAAYAAEEALLHAPPKPQGPAPLPARDTISPPAPQPGHQRPK